MAKNNLGMTMRTYHRSLGFFLAGIMFVYAFSGIVLIFRDTDFLKVTDTINKQIKPNAEGEEIGQLLGLRGFNIDKEEGNMVYFQNGFYNKATGEGQYDIKRLPLVLDKMTHLHKAKSADTLFFLNIFFGMALLFFVISAFWMYTPKTSVFKKGMVFTGVGIIFTLILLFL
ncbi:MAG: PepSY domain-containing protein [Marinoscillum sp.]